MHLLKTAALSRSELSQLPHSGLLGNDRQNRLEAGFPLLITNSGRVHEGAFAFLLDTYRADPTRSRVRTLMTYAEGLKSWLEYLDLRAADWRRPTAVHLSEYRRSLTSARSDGRRLAAATVNLRTATILEFYRFLSVADAGALIENDGSWDRTPITQFLHRTRRLQRAKDYRRKQRALTGEEVAIMLASLPQPHQLIFQWTLATGARRSTIIDLRLGALPTLVHAINYIEATAKGAKAIQIAVPRGILERTLEYSQTIRHTFSSRGGGGSDKIFVGPRGSPVTAEGYYQVFYRVSKARGLQIHPHMARHTFAVRMEAKLALMAKQGASINSVKVIQHLLAHNNAETTEHYLRSVKSMEAGVVRALLELEEEVL